MTTLLVTTEEYRDLGQDRPLLLMEKNSGNLTSSFCMRSSNPRAASVPSYKRTHSLGFALPFCRTQHAPLLLSEKVYQNVSIILQSFFNMTRRSKNLKLTPFYGTDYYRAS